MTDLSETIEFYTLSIFRASQSSNKLGQLPYSETTITPNPGYGLYKKIYKDLMMITEDNSKSRKKVSELQKFISGDNSSTTSCCVSLLIFLTIDV